MNKLAAILIACRCIAAIAAICVATVLGCYDKAVWGWILFAALCLGCVSVKGN